MESAEYFTLDGTILLQCKISCDCQGWYACQSNRITKCCFIRSQVVKKWFTKNWTARSFEIGPSTFVRKDRFVSTQFECSIDLVIFYLKFWSLLDSRAIHYRWPTNFSPYECSRIHRSLLADEMWPFFLHLTQINKHFNRFHFNF